MVSACFPPLLLGSGRGLDKPTSRRGAAERRFSARLAAGIEALAGAGDFRLVADRPGAQRGDGLQKIAAERRELIVDPRRNGGKYRAGDQPVAFQPAQGEGEHALRNAADGATQLIEAHGAWAEPRDDEDRPLVADPGQHVADGAAVGGQMRVSWFHGCAFLQEPRIVTYLALVTNSTRGLQHAYPPERQGPDRRDRRL